MQPIPTVRPAVYGYSRHAAQDAPGVIEQQEAAMKTYAAMHLPGAEYLCAWVDDADQRPRFLPYRLEGQAMMLMVDRSDHVVVAQYRRAFRHLRDLANLLAVLEGRGAHLHILDLGVSPLTESGRTVLAALLVLAHADRAAAREKASAEMRRRRLTGKLVNGAPGLGYRLAGPAGNRRRVPDEYEQQILAKIVAWRHGGHTWEAIYYHLLHQGVRRSADREWSMGAILRGYRAGLRLQREAIARASASDPAGAPAPA